jgi:hypothetical protein
MPIDQRDQHERDEPEMTTNTYTPAATRSIADQASDAVRALNHATHPADGFPGLELPADAYYLLGHLHQVATRLPQLLMQISAFLQVQLQHDVIVVDDGKFAGDPLGAVGTASHALDECARRAARTLAAAIDTARQAIAFVGSADDDGEQR